MNNFEKQQVLNHLSKERFGVKYHQYIDSIYNGSKSIDETEYKVFKEQTLRMDFRTVNVALASQLITFNQAWELITALVGFDLMIKGFLDKKNKDEKESTDTKEK